jgi:hypothetical protein
VHAGYFSLSGFYDGGGWLRKGAGQRKKPGSYENKQAQTGAAGSFGTIKEMHAANSEKPGKICA